jgi:hypothetical protein
MWLVGTFLGLVIAVGAHAGLCRAAMPLNAVTRFLIPGTLVGACLAWWLLDRYGATAPQAWAGALIYAFGCELYVFLFTLAISSVSANLLTNLLQQDMTDQDVERVYDSRQMVAARLDRLIATGLLDESPSGLRLTTDGARIVCTFHRLRSFFRHPLPTYDIPADD